MSFEGMPSAPEQKENKIENINEAFKVVENLKEKLMSGDLSDIQDNLDEVKKAEEFVASFLPEIDLENTKKKGFYTPADQIYNALRFICQSLDNQDEQQLNRAIIAVDEVLKLMKGSSSELSQGDFEKRGLLNLLSIPEKWKNENGKYFIDEIDRFVLMRKQGLEITQSDIGILRNASTTIARVSEESDYSQDMIDKVPSVRKLILINLELLISIAGKYKGKKLPTGEGSLETISLIRGLYNYDKEEYKKFAAGYDISNTNIPYIPENPELKNKLQIKK